MIEMADKPYDPNDPTFKWVQAIHRDLSNLRDNHLAHIDADLTSLKTDLRIQKHDLNMIQKDLNEVLPTIREIQFFNSRIGRKLLLFVGILVAAYVGIPMIGIETL